MRNLGKCGVCCVVSMLVCGVASAATITNVVLTGTGLDPAGAQIVPGGFGEDVDAFTDRTHEWNGDTGGEPTIADLGLVGADYVMFANNDRSPADFNAALTLSQKADVYFFMDTRVSQPKAWMTALGLADIGYNIGVDESGNGVGPGVSIENDSNIYMVSLPAGTHNFGAQGQGGTNMYGIVAVPAGKVPEPATLTLVGLGVCGVCASWRRRRA